MGTNEQVNSMEIYRWFSGGSSDSELILLSQWAFEIGSDGEVALAGER